MILCISFRSLWYSLCLWRKTYVLNRRRCKKPAKKKWTQWWFKSLLPYAFLSFSLFLLIMECSLNVRKLRYDVVVVVSHVLLVNKLQYDYHCKLNWTILMNSHEQNSQLKYSVALCNYDEIQDICVMAVVTQCIGIKPREHLGLSLFYHL